MFDKEFYPTPKSVVEKMLSPYVKKFQVEEGYGFHRWKTNLKSLGEISILEPSAGKGDILDVVNSICAHYEKPDFYCIERNHELQSILREKDYTIIGEDFLQYNGDYYFDLILMNPPFSNGDQHLLKAWEILKQGDICCLLNSETINNPFTERRKLLARIIEENGSVEELGDVFSDAERRADVNVSLIRLRKQPEKSSLDFEFENVTKEKQIHIDESTINNPIATRDAIGNMMLQYDKLKESFVEFLKIREQLVFYSQGIMDDRGYNDIFKVMDKAMKKGTKQGKYNRFCDGMKQELWAIVMGKLNMEKYMTHKVRENFSAFRQQQGSMDFTKENVANLVNLIFDNRLNILEQAVLEVFDIFTSYHKENRCHVEGWKTNDHWKVNRKIILPFGVKYGEYMTQHSLNQFGDKFKTCYDKRSQYSDIDKVMCYLSGINYKDVTTIQQALEAKFDQLGHVRSGTFDNKCESTFFNIRFFKKGTIHIEFKDEKLWQEFNMRSCAGKNWLPDNERKEWEETKEQQQAPVQPEPVYPDHKGQLRLIA